MLSEDAEELHIRAIQAMSILLVLYIDRDARLPWQNCSVIFNILNGYLCYNNMAGVANILHHSTRPKSLQRDLRLMASVVNSSLGLSNSHIWRLEVKISTGHYSRGHGALSKLTFVFFCLL